MTTPSSDELKAFRAFEQSGWDASADKYDQRFGHLTPFFCEPLLDGAGVTAGIRVLDIATGPGYVAGAAADRGADVIGIDFAPSMVTAARKLNPNASF
jgi:2-polyprenyl-3-methyl-5-hydroxy-6-metoxy-1,4-benzoquinol methylase